MILVTGASGFVGSHLVKGLSEAGHSVRAMVRRPGEVERIKGERIEAAIGDVGNPESLLSAVRGCEAVIHLVGIIQPGPGYSFKSVHVDGTKNVIEAAKAAGTVRHFIYQSALGTGPDAKGGYYETKYAAEGLTKASGLEYTITRPSIIFGKGDGFTARMVQLVNQMPVVPVVGSGTVKLQPVYIDDLVEVFKRIILNPGFYGKTLEVGGPEQLTFNEIMDDIKGALGSKKPTVHVPLCLVRSAAAVMERLLPHPPVTNEQLDMLQKDNVCDTGALEGLGISPTPFKAGLKKFL